MRTMIGAVGLAVVLCAAVVSNANAGVSVEVSVGGHHGFGPGVDCGFDDLDREDLIVINNNQVGFWVMLPSGRWVFQCRSMWFDSEWNEWRYGPWWHDYAVSYSCHCHDSFRQFCPFHGVQFHTYMHRHYPKYWNRTFSHRVIRVPDRHVRYADHRGPGRIAPARHPVTVIERTRIVTPAAKHSVERNGGLRKSAETRQPGVGAPATTRPQTMGKSDRGQNNNSGNRPTMRRQLGR